jgi:small ligand-binding sensory domain FIST
LFGSIRILPARLCQINASLLYFNTLRTGRPDCSRHALAGQVNADKPENHGTAMIHAAVGVSSHTNTARAALDAAQQVLQQLGENTPDWCVVFVTDEHLEFLESMQQSLTQALGTPYVVGCSVAGVLAAGEEIEAGPALGVLAVHSDQLRATPFLFRDTGDHGLTAATRLGQRMAGSRNSGDLLVVWPDPYHVRPDRLLTGLDAILPGLPVVGGAASGRTDGTTIQFCGTESAAAGISGLRLGGDFNHVVAVTHGCAPLTQPLRATQVHENLILELDGRPAFDVLKEHAPKHLMQDLSSAVHHLFVGLLPPGASEDDYLIRNIVTADPDTGVVAISDRVGEGQQLVLALRESGAARRDIARVLDRVRSEMTDRQYRFGLYFNCLARGQALYQEAGVDAAEIRRAFPDVPILGFFCNAEIGPLKGENQLFTYTGVLVLVGE